MLPLQISKKNSIYHLKGQIVARNVTKLLNYFIKKIDKKKTITLNIQEAIKIDKKGLNALKELMNLATSKEKRFFIVGDGCKEIYDHFYEAS
jgi:ABC-type transporter Mla MlaB component